MKKVYFMLADGFEETEFVTPWDILLRAGAEVTVFSVSGRQEVTGSHGLAVKADKPITEAKADCDMIVLPGGGKGSENLGNSEDVEKLVKAVYANGGYCAAICAAPTVLARFGLLKGVEAICFPGMEKELTGAIVSDKKVVTCGKIITGAGMGVSLPFGLALTEAMFGKAVSEQIAERIVSL